MRLNTINVRQFLKKRITAHHYSGQSKVILRGGLILAIFLFAAFGLLDEQLFPSSYLRLYVIRYGIIIPVFIACFLLTHVRIFARHLQLISFMATLVASLGLVKALSISQGEGDLIYFSGLIVTVSFSPMVLGLNAFFTTISTVTTFVVFNIITDEVACTDADLLRCNIFIGRNAILITAGTLGCIFQFIIGRLLRSNELNILQLTRQKLQLEKSRQDLAQSYNIKDKLLFIISHDIRGPLASIKGILNLYSSTRITKEEFQQHALKLTGLLQGTGSLLDNLLIWSVSQHENEGLKKTECHIHGMIEDNFKLFEFHASNKGIELINLVDPGLYLFADHDLINIVFRNIISNAVKFTGSGSLTVRSVREEDGIELIFADTGIGIEQEKIQRLFQWKKMESSLGTRGEKGTGLGLLLCREFIKKHNGNLFLRTRERYGTTVSILLPVSLHIQKPSAQTISGQFAVPSIL